MFTLPALLKIFFVFGLILLLNRTRLTLSLCMVSGAVVLAFWMRMPISEFFQSVSVNLTQIQTISLVLIVGIILIMSGLMKESGQLERIVTCFSSVFRDDRKSGAFLAGLIGLLPMPGGALFSAPMVETAFADRSISNEMKTVINYWFRHIWEYWWPLYPGVVLAVALLEVPTWQFMAFMAPMTVVTVSAGFFFILRPLGHSLPDRDWRDMKAGLKSFLWEIMPILIVVLVIILQGGLMKMLRMAGHVFDIPGVISILPGLVAAMIWVCWINRIPFTRIRAAFLDKNILPLVFLVAAIMVFKGVLEDSRAVTQIRNEMVAYNIPALLIVMMTPFLSGLLTGIAIGFVGVSFPLIIPLFPSVSVSDYLAHALLAYSFGYMGMMLSPVHLCFLVTKDFYKASLIKCYRYLILPAMTVMACSVLVFKILSVTNAFGK